MATRALVLGVSPRPETFIRQILDGLPAHGVEVRVVPTAPGPARRAVAAVARTSRRDDEVARAARTARTWRPDVAYFPWNSAAVTHRGLLEGPVPAVISCRGSQVGVAATDPDRAGHTEDLRATLGRATLVHCVSAEMADRAAALGVDRGRIRIIRPAVDVGRFRAPAAPRPPDGRFRVVTTGSLIWRKGTEDLLVALAAVVAAGVDAHLDVVGTGPEEERVRFTVADLGLEGHVTLRGALAPDEVGATLAGADAFALPSLYEGISNAVLEAMACGLPVVASAVGGMAEVVTDDVGVLVPARRPAVLADALLGLARDPERRRALGTAARARVVRDHALDDQLAAYAALLAEAAGEGRAGVGK